MAEWLGRALQKLLQRFESASDLIHSVEEKIAQVAELVDALVSNTCEVTLVPVRLRSWAQTRSEMTGFFVCASLTFSAFLMHNKKKLEHNLFHQAFLNLTDPCWAVDEDF